MELPSISHLSKEEQGIILKVIKRQQDEDVKEKAMIKTLHQQFENYREQVQKASEDAARKIKQSPNDIKELCSLCHKTKMAEGCGHTCTYCTKIFCSRCGGHVAVKSNKLMYICNLCRKKQEILTKTGAWHRAEQSRTNFSLQLEQPPKHDSQKITGSVSLAQLDGRRPRSDGKSKSLELKKGASEPQLAKSEQVLDTLSAQRNETQDVAETSRVEVPERKGKTLCKDESISQSPGASVRTDHGIRRSSTNSERRLYRQEHALCGQQEFPSYSERKENNASMAPKSACEKNSSLTGFSDKNELNYQVHNQSIAVLKEEFKTGISQSTSRSNTDERVQERKTDQPSSLRNIGFKNNSSPIGTESHSDLSSARTFSTIGNAHSDSSFVQSGHNATQRSVPKQASRIGSPQPEDNPKTRLEIKESALMESDRGYSAARQPGKHNAETVKNQQGDVLINSSNKRRCRSPSPKATSSSPRMLLSPEVGHRYFNRKSPELPRKVMNRIEVDRRRARDDYTSSHCQRRSRSPIKKETRKSRRHHSTRHKVFLSDEAEHSDRCRQPAGDRHGLSSSCMDICHAHHPSTVMFDNRSSSSLHSHCPPDYSSFSRPDDRNVCHSDFNLSRSCNYSPESAVHSPTCRRKHHSPNRRQSNSKHDPDDCSQASKSQRYKNRTGKHVKRKPSASSTDDEMQSTPDYSSCEETEKKLSSCRGGNPVLFKSTESGYCSSYVNQHSDKQFVSWQPSSDGTYLVGQMVLNKSGNSLAEGQSNVPSNAKLGMKVAGGKLNRAGELAAYVAEVKKDSIADAVGCIKVGDEVLKWNDRKLRGASYEEVCQVILASKDNKMVKLVVVRPIQESHRAVECRYPYPMTESRSDMTIISRVGSHSRISSPSTSQPIMPRPSETLPGKLQVSIWYDDATQHLYITVLQAAELSLRPGRLSRNPFVKMYLLPDRSALSTKQTKIAKKTLHPIWNQSLVYGNIRKQDLDSMALELTMWDFDRSADNCCRFLGEVLVDLGLARVDDVPQWYKLMPAEEGLNQAVEPAQTYALVSGQHYTHGKLTQRSCQQKDDHSLSSHDVVSRCERDSALKESEIRTGVKHQQRDATCEANFNADQCRSHPITAQRPSHNDDALSRPPPCTNQHSSHIDVPGGSKPVHKSNRTDNEFSTSGGVTRSNLVKEVLSKEGKSCQSFPTIQLQTKVSDTLLKQPCRDVTKVSSTSSKNVESRNETTKENAKPARNKISIVGEGKRTRSAENVKHDEESSSSIRVTDDTLSKSVSLEANLPSQRKSKNLGPKKSSPNSKTSSPSNRSNKFFSQKLTNLVGLKNRSQSSSTLDGKKQFISTRCSEFGVHPTLQRDSSRESGSGSVQSLASDGSARSVDKTLKEFIGDLGVGQVAGRQVLTASSLGEIKLNIRRTETDFLQVDIVQARGLVLKLTAKALPAVLVKVYLMFDTQCSAKQKSKPVQVSRSLNARFDQTVSFEPSICGKSLHIIVWGDYGRLDSKVFMGIAQIKLMCDDSTVEQGGWYKLFPTNSIVETSLFDHQTGSKSSLDSDVGSFRG